MRSKVFVFSFVAMCATDAAAGALSWNTRMSCTSEYYAYCSMHTPGSAGCHACMRANRSRLTDACVSALIGDGVLKDKSAKRQTKLAGASKARASRNARRNATTTVAKLPPAKTGETQAPKSTPEASAINAALQTTSPEQPSPATQTSAAQSDQAEKIVQTVKPETPAQAAGMDQKTFEALKNREPYFVVQEDLASIFSRADEKPATQVPPGR